MSMVGFNLLEACAPAARGDFRSSDIKPNGRTCGHCHYEVRGAVRTGSRHRGLEEGRVPQRSGVTLSTQQGQSTLKSGGGGGVALDSGWSVKERKLNK
jgi:hypothetical protein